MLGGGVCRVVLVGPWDCEDDVGGEIISDGVVVLLVTVCLEMGGLPDMVFCVCLEMGDAATTGGLLGDDGRSPPGVEAGLGIVFIKLLLLASFALVVVLLPLLDSEVAGANFRLGMLKVASRFWLSVCFRGMLSVFVFLGMLPLFVGEELDDGLLRLERRTGLFLGPPPWLSSSSSSSLSS